MCKQGSIFIYKTKKLQNSSLVKKIKENQTETKLQNSSLVKKIKEKQTQLSILDIDIYRIKLNFFFELVSCFNLLQVHVLVAQTRIFPWITNLLKQFTIQILKKNWESILFMYNIKTRTKIRLRCPPLFLVWCCVSKNS